MAGEGVLALGAASAPGIIDCKTARTIADLRTTPVRAEHLAEAFKSACCERRSRRTKPPMVRAAL
jgi:hypothetical protein